MTRVLVVGSGAIGSLFAAHLARVEDVEVWAYDVSEALVNSINANGLRIGGLDGFTSRITARTSLGDIPECDFGIVATKSEHTRSAVSAVAAALAGAAVASVQNGIGNEEIVAESVRRVIRGSTLVAGSIVEPGVVRLDAPGDTWLGPFEPSPAAAVQIEQLADLMSRGGLPTHALADSRGAQWTKLIFNAANNALCAATGLTVGQLGDSSSLRALAESVIAEGSAVAAALGIELESDPEAMFEDAVAHAYGHRPSMLQDVAARRHTEIAVLNGGIVTEGRRVGVPTPSNEALVAIVEGIELSWAETAGAGHNH
ncbi:MAG TPA: 2-dehydropantoate 2-reductase [Galbitalea sp.]|nr:2-dehydropantoate 2-reductase [Galbitalea sp.]